MFNELKRKLDKLDSVAEDVKGRLAPLYSLLSLTFFSNTSAKGRSLHF